MPCEIAEMARIFCCTGICRPAVSGVIKPLWWIIARNAVLILVYYILSIGLTFYQNNLLKKIHFPLMQVLCHLFVKFFLASLLRCSYQLITKKQSVTLDCGTWIRRVSLVGISGGLDIGLSNWSQELITVSLYTMTKSTAIIFILGFALAFKLEEKHWSIVIIVSLISSGLVMFTYKSNQFELEGFLLVLTASFLSGLRWSMTQLVLQKSKLGLQNPIDMVYHAQPWMIVAVLPFAVLFEGQEILQQTLSLNTPEEWDAAFEIALKILVGALMAFFMEVGEYLVITFTSSLTFAVAGIFKEICTLCLAVIINGDEMTFLNFIGLLTCLVGIICHVAFKFTKSAKELKTPAVSPNHVIQSPLEVITKGPGKYDSQISYRSNFFQSQETEAGRPLLKEYTQMDELQLLSELNNEDSDEDEVIWRS